MAGCGSQEHRSEQSRALRLRCGFNRQHKRLDAFAANLASQLLDAFHKLPGGLVLNADSQDVVVLGPDVSSQVRPAGIALPQYLGPLDLCLDATPRISGV